MINRQRRVSNGANPSLLSAMAFLRTLSCVLLILLPVVTAEPDALLDYCVADVASSSIKVNGLPCLNPTEVRAEHFKTPVLGITGNTSGSGLSATLITPQSLPAINTLGLTMIRFDIATGGLIPPHIHQRATEMVFVQKGILNVGFVDTNNKHFSTKLKKGDTFLFPKAIIHYLQNIGKTPVVLIGSFNSQSPGTSILSSTLFASTPPIPASILSKAFQIDETEVAKIKKKFGG